MPVFDIALFNGLGQLIEFRSATMHILFSF